MLKIIADGVCTGYLEAVMEDKFTSLCCWKPGTSSVFFRHSPKKKKKDSAGISVKKQKKEKSALRSQEKEGP